MKIQFLAAATIVCLSTQALAAEDSASATPGEGFDIKPVLLDSDNTNGATVGVEYSLRGKYPLPFLDGNDSGNDTIDPEVSLNSFVVSYQGQGTIAASAARNPKNFVDGSVSLAGMHSGTGAGTVYLGGFAKLESDQEFKKIQTVVGARITWAKANLPKPGDYLALDANYGQVNPGDDTDRKTALAVTKLSNYNRIDLEALYHIDVKVSVLESIELNYRYFKEPDAPAAIKLAKLDEHHLATVRLGLTRGLFLAYSEGKLPFDRKDDQIVQIGFSYKLF